MKVFASTMILALAGATATYAADATAGKPVYDRACKSCHGADGSGNPGIAKAMKVELKDIRQSSDADIKKAVTSGVGKMKPVPSVNAAQTDDLIAYLRSIK
jgi:predicted CXXCH cytochrome family protein